MASPDRLIRRSIKNTPTGPALIAITIAPTSARVMNPYWTNGSNRNP